jgi:predicted ATP-grasp superfamily ATP-dependent carboligase
VGCDIWGYALTSDRSQPLLILGASARAAAQSATRAGLVPSAVDQFCDEDLRSCCTSHRAINYPDDLARIARELAESPWMYTGALENHPRLVDTIGATRTLYGNPGSVLRAVRDPLTVAEILHGDGLPHLDVRSSPPRTRAGAWLRKPLDSCGGGRIALATNADVREGGERDHAFYYQKLAEGDPASAVYVADGKRALLLGVTRQLLGLTWAGGVGFQYGGSIGPLQLAPEAEALVRRIGTCLAAFCGLKGLFGVDLITAGDKVWAIEVNPRYTASVEVIERAHSLSAISLHVAVFRGQALPSRVPDAFNHFVGKAIVYATQAGVVRKRFGDLALRLNAESPWPSLADVPGVGTELKPGHPIATVLATGSSMGAVERRLKILARQVRGTVSSDAGL